MELTKVKYDNLLEHFKELKENPKEEYILLDKPEDLVIVSLSRDSKFKPEDIEPPCYALKLDRTGGTIIGFKDSITLFHLYNRDIKKNDIRDLMYESIRMRLAITKYLKSRGIRAELIKNDIVVDGKYKVCGCNHTDFKRGWGLLGMHISINMDLDLIKKYCDKPMCKIPKGLGAYGITRQEIIDFIESYISNKGEI